VTLGVRGLSMRFALTFVLALLGLVVSGGDVAAQSNTCTNVSGVIEGQIIGPTAQCGGGLTEIGTFTGTGDGTFVACITPVRTNGKGTLFLSLTHTYTTLSGDTFTTTDTVVAAPVQPPVYRINNRVNVRSLSHARHGEPPDGSALADVPRPALHALEGKAGEMRNIRADPPCGASLLAKLTWSTLR
jgi:hypothetical protein